MKILTNNKMSSFSLDRKARQYCLSLNTDFINHVEEIEIPDEYLSLPEKYTAFYGDLIVENVSKPIKKIYKLNWHKYDIDHINPRGSIILFIDDTLQYMLYDEKLNYEQCYTGHLLSAST